MWDAVKTVLKGKFIAVDAYSRKEISKTNHLNLPLRQLEKEEQIKTKISRRKEKIKLEQKSMKLKTKNQ